MKWRTTANSREDMPDGSIIQDRDPLMVPSTRRNPVLADVFNRLWYMERKGSGFGKIISGYEFQINYNESKRPSFRSDRYQFTVVMPNLNYDVPQDKLDAQTMDFKVSRQNQLTYWYFPSRLLPNKSGLLPKLNNCYSISTYTSRRGVSWMSSRAGSLRTCTGFQECFSMQKLKRKFNRIMCIKYMVTR